jgi:hypothetical protein
VCPSVARTHFARTVGGGWSRVTVKACGLRRLGQPIL